MTQEGERGEVVHKKQDDYVSIPMGIWYLPETYRQSEFYVAKTCFVYPGHEQLPQQNVCMVLVPGYPWSAKAHHYQNAAYAFTAATDIPCITGSAQLVGKHEIIEELTYYEALALVEQLYCYGYTDLFLVGHSRGGKIIMHMDAIIREIPKYQHMRTMMLGLFEPAGTEDVEPHELVKRFCATMPISSMAKAPRYQRDARFAVEHRMQLNHLLKATDNWMHIITASIALSGKNWKDTGASVNVHEAMLTARQIIGRFLHSPDQAQQEIRNIAQRIPYWVTQGNTRVLMIRSEHDSVAPPSAICAQALFPQSTYVVDMIIPNSTHGSLDTHTSVYCEALVAFLEYIVGSDALLSERG